MELLYQATVFVDFLPLGFFYVREENLVLLNCSSQILVSFSLSFLFWPYLTACGHLVPQPGTELGPQQWEYRVLASGLPGNSRFCFLQHSLVLTKSLAQAVIKTINVLNILHRWVIGDRLSIIFKSIVIWYMRQFKYPKREGKLLVVTTFSHKLRRY